MDSSLLTALQHADSAFPSGGFAFSQGLEATAAMSDALGAFDLSHFLEIQFRHRWMTADRVALVRAFRAKGSVEKIRVLDLEVETSMAHHALREGSRRNGTALLVAHERLGLDAARRYRALVREGKAPGHCAVMQGYLWQALGMSEPTAVSVAAYQCLSSLCTAAIRLGLVGAIEAQKILSSTIGQIAGQLEPSTAEEEPLASFTPLHEIALARHGRTGQRLFSN